MKKMKHGGKVHKRMQVGGKVMDPSFAAAAAANPANAPVRGAAPVGGRGMPMRGGRRMMGGPGIGRGMPMRGTKGPMVRPGTMVSPAPAVNLPGALPGTVGSAPISQQAAAQQVGLSAPQQVGLSAPQTPTKASGTGPMPSTNVLKPPPGLTFKKGGAVKSKAMRGGGLARKGVGMALAKGGLARRAGGCAKRGFGKGKIV